MRSNLRASLSILLLILAAASPVFSQERRTTPAPLFEGLENQWISEAQDGNQKALQEMLAEEFTLADSKTWNRAEYLASLKNQKQEEIRVSELTARVYCNTAVVKFQMTKASTHRFLVTDIWNESTDGTWTVIARHISPEK